MRIADCKPLKVCFNPQSRRASLTVGLEPLLINASLTVYCFPFGGVTKVEGAGEGVGEAGGDATVVGEGTGEGACSGTPDCNTERVPVIAGSESIKAISMNAAAAPIVILASNVCVPRGPKAVLDMLLENSAPASAAHAKSAVS